MYIYLLVILVLLICNIYLFIKIRTFLRKYEDIGTGRYGFYINGKSYKAFVYVKEIDRFSNGFSKIKLDNIEAIDKFPSTIKSAKDSFITLKKTDEIDWLEGEEQIKKRRREKLENLKKI